MLDQLFSLLTNRGLSGLPAIAGALLLLLPLFFLGTVVYNLFFHPLASIPGPIYTRASRFWYTYHILRGQLPFAIRVLHEKYGDIVRVAPNEVSCISADAWKDIYGHRSGKPEMQKDPIFYANLSSGPTSVIRADRERHGHLRRLLAHGFSDKALREQEREIQIYAGLLMKRLHEKSENGNKPVDMVAWYNYFTFDLIGDLAFGESFECLETSSYHPWVSIVFDNVKIGTFFASAQHYPLIQRLIRPLLPKEAAARRIKHRELSEVKARRRIEMKTERSDFLGRMAEKDSGASLREFIDTASTLIIAGSETTATLLSGVTYYLLTYPETMKKLVKEVRSSFKSEDEISLININNLKYMLACLEEALRIYPPVPGNFPRNVPPGGDYVNGQWLPENTVISVSHWAAYHNEENFRRAEEFIPERWLGDPEFEADNKAVLQPFHVGPRNCLGKNLAYLEMKLVMARLLWNFDLELEKSSAGWNKQSVFLLWEKPALWVRLKPVSRKGE